MYERPSSAWTTWWPWRGRNTRSHPELGRENPLRRWYCVLRRGRVGHRQVFQADGGIVSDKPHNHVVSGSAGSERESCGTRGPGAGGVRPVEVG